MNGTTCMATWKSPNEETNIILSLIYSKTNLPELRKITNSWLPSPKLFLSVSTVSLTHDVHSGVGDDTSSDVSGVAVVSTSILPLYICDDKLIHVIQIHLKSPGPCSWKVCTTVLTPGEIRLWIALSCTEEFRILAGLNCDVVWYVSEWWENCKLGKMPLLSVNILLCNWCCKSEDSYCSYSIFNRIEL